MPYYTHTQLAYDESAGHFTPSNGEYQYRVDRTLVIADVPFRTKNAADIREKVKELGFRFDFATKQWSKDSTTPGFMQIVKDMLAEGVSPAAVHHQIWVDMPHDIGVTRLDLKVPFTEKATVKSMGGRWDAANKCWYVDCSKIGDGDMNLLNQNRWIQDWPNSYTGCEGSGADLAISDALMDDFRASGGEIHTATLQDNTLTAVFLYAVHGDHDMPVHVNMSNEQGIGMGYGYTSRERARNLYNQLASSGYSPTDHSW